MAISDLQQIVVYISILLICTPLLGHYMASVYQGGPHLLSPVLGWLERALYRLAGLREDAEQDWRQYAKDLLIFNLLGLLVLYGLLRLQGILPWNPQHLPGLRPDLAFNTAISFVTNTNWQSYRAERTLSYFSQMVGLTVQNFVSPAVGMGVALVVIRALVRQRARTVGHFYVDMIRTILYVLLPIAFMAAVVLVWQGVPQNLHPYVHAKTLEGGQQIIAQGPAASQIAIKQLGSNGGGFFNANSSHPYENPTPFSNLMEMVFLLLIPSSFLYTFGLMVKDYRQGWALYAAAGLLFLTGLLFAYEADRSGNALLNTLPINTSIGYMEGKEVRFGAVNSMLWAEATTASSNGSVNAMYDSLPPLAGLIPLFNILLGEVIFGGVGAGFYGLMVYIILTVFIAGLMVGRTPEYLGKKIEAREVTLSLIAFFSSVVGVVVLTAISSVLPEGTRSLQNAGPHGFSELIYAYASATGNNGSAFGGFNGNVTFHNVLLGIAMLIGRFMIIVPLLAIGGSMVGKSAIPASSGTFPTHTPLFVVLLISVILILGGLTYFPALVLGPIAEHLAMRAGIQY